MKQTYFQTTPHTSSPLQRLSPTHTNSSTFIVDGQFERIGLSRPPQGEVQNNNSHSAIHSSGAQSSTSELAFSSDLSTIDREFLGFNSMNHSKKPSTHPSTTDSRHSYKSIGRSQNSLLAPQPYKISRLCMQHAAAMSFPHIASKSSNDREMLQVVEGYVPMNSAAGVTTIRPSSKSTSGTKQTKKSGPRKRKGDVDGEPAKKPKLDKTTKAKRTPKPKLEKKELVCAPHHYRGRPQLTLIQAKYQLDHAIWMRILEFTPVQFLGKARLICKEFRAMVDQFTSIYVNCRKENYGHDMPPPPLGLTERQYSNLLGSKGCLEPGCADKNASRTHWSWAKRWCVKCWRSKIEREDRLIKNRADRFTNRTTLTKLLECIPVGMHDSFMKPHDYIDVDDNRPRGAPRLYKYYLKEDVERIFQQYDDLKPEPYEEDPNKTAEENEAVFTRHQEELAGLDEKRANFLATEKAKIDAHMELVQKIEAGVRKRREANRTPYDENRNARKELFTRRAKEDLPHIDEDFVKNTTAFKAATRVFRDGGTERGWQTLKPKIEKEWETSRGKFPANNSSNDLPQLDVDMDDEVEFDEINTDIDSSQTRILQRHITQYGRTQAEAFLDRRNMARVPRPTRALPPPSFIAAATASMGHSNISRQPLSSSLGMGSLFPGIIPTAVSTSHGHTGNSLSASLALSNSQWQAQFSSSQAASMPSASTGTMNGSSSAPMAISSLIHTTPSSSQTGNSS